MSTLVNIYGINAPTYRVRRPITQTLCRLQVPSFEALLRTHSDSPTRTVLCEKKSTVNDVGGGSRSCTILILRPVVVVVASFLTQTTPLVENRHPVPSPPVLHPTRMKVVLKAGGIRTNLLAAEESTEIVSRFAKQISVDGSVPFAIDLSCRSWGKEAVAVLVEFFLNNNVSQNVVFLNLADCIASRPTDEGLEVMQQLATALADSSKLIEIDLSDNAMGPRGLSPVKALLDNHSIERLYLSNCGFSFESMEFLRDSIQLNDGQMAKSLTELILDRNMIGVDGAKVVGDFLKDCQNLQLFSYAGCRPGPKGTKAICDGIEGLAAEGSQLRHIDLDDCSLGQGQENDDAVLPLSRALKNSPQLTFLSMRDGDLGVTGVELVVEALLESKAKLVHLVLGTYSVKFQIV
jgi:hypothetical protein